MVSMTTAVRGSAVFCVSACVAAVALGRMTTAEPTLRSWDGTKLVCLTLLDKARGDQRLSFVDLKTGTEQSLRLSPGERLDQPAAAPWHEESGQTQIVGFWSRRSGTGANGLTRETGLARFRFPEGTALDRVALDVTPYGAPCWYPGTKAQVLFADGGGTLWRFAFEGSLEPDVTSDGRDARPSPIVWKTAPPGVDERSVRMYEPSWPEGRAFDGKLIVSLSHQVRDQNGHRYTAPKLWWLSLDAEGRAIEAAGPLTRDDEDSETKERCARVFKAPSGKFQVAYLVKHLEQSSWELAVAPLAFDGDGQPFSPPGLAVPLANQAAMVAPAFSEDGRWLYYLALPHEEGNARRVAIPPLGDGVHGLRAAH